MISSMTGFGQAVAEVDGVIYTVEIRSVNNRYFKSSVRTSDLVSFMEDELEKRLRSLLHRGSINFNLRMKNVDSQALFEIDETTLRNYIDRLARMIGPQEPHCTVDLANLLALPGIVQPLTPDTEKLERMRGTILALTDEAVRVLQNTRREEGRLLLEDLLANCQVIRRHLETIRSRQDLVVREYHMRLRKRVEDLLGQAQLHLDEDLLAREVAVYAERSDIAEEVTRLETHIGQFESCCRNGGPAGRRLDFISQEMLREANTIGSKASDAAIAQCVIEIKCAVDRIKEQVQNVE
jgi:uncharacterized protein (TIGR00255 family)